MISHYDMFGNNFRQAWSGLRQALERLFMVLYYTVRWNVALYRLKAWEFSVEQRLMMYGTRYTLLDVLKNDGGALLGWAAQPEIILNAIDPFWRHRINGAHGIHGDRLQIDRISMYDADGTIRRYTDDWIYVGPSTVSGHHYYARPLEA